MVDTLAGILTIVIVFSPFVILIVWAVRYQRKMFAKSWNNVQDLFVAQKIRLTSQIPQKTTVILNLSGEFNEGSIEVKNIFIGAGKSRKMLTKAIIQSKHQIPNFRITHENIFTKMGEGLGIKDVKTGNEIFDRSFRLEISESEKGMIFTELMIREFILREKDFRGAVDCRNNVIQVAYYGAPGYKIALRQFTALFEMAMKVATMKFKGLGHSPGATV
jgi:hypothetical protein